VAHRALDLVERLLDLTAHRLLAGEALQGEVVDGELEEGGGRGEEGEEEFRREMFTQRAPSACQGSAALYPECPRGGIIAGIVSFAHSRARSRKGRR
jgi:hypothetical protein